MKHLFKYILCALSLIVVASCGKEDVVVQDDYGYVQFDVAARGTRAGNKLEFLSDAKKVRLVLTHEGRTFTQTLSLRAYNEEAANISQQSEKLLLATGHYALSGFYLYNALDEEIYASGGNGANFDIVAGGLHVQPLDVDAVLRGMVCFDLVKKFVETRAEAKEEYAFSSIKGASFTVENIFTHETFAINKVKVSHVKASDTDEQGNKYVTSVAECDTTVWLPIGTYQVIDYTTYSDKNCRYLLEASKVSNAPSFVVRTNEKTLEAPVPILLSKTDERIKDYVALKAIWEALDGPHWSYIGEAATPGINWDFDKDMDLWGEQPGVSLDGNGRVEVLSLLGFGARGVVPDEIGQLTQLSVLYLGAHDETVGGLIGSDLSAWNTPDRKDYVRHSYENLFLRRDGREGFSEPMREAINRDPNQRPILSARVELKDVQRGYLTNRITGISRAVMRLTELQQFYIANSPITTDGFFRDIQPESPYYGEELKWENMKDLTTIELYNCPKLTGLPMEMLGHLPELQVLNVASNMGISGTQLKADWEGIIRSKSGEKLQMLYLGFNNLEETPSYDDLSRMYKLGLLDITNNKLHTIHPFGKDVNISKLYLDHNRLTSIPTAADGYFCGTYDVESMTFDYNQLTELPDIFNAHSTYTMETVSFAHNNITQLQHGEAFRGINAKQVDLSYNHFEVMPKEIIGSGSPIQYLIMAGNGMREIPEGSLTGPKSFHLTSVDFSFNKLSKLPEDFYATNLPYLYGVDLTGNQFSEIPTQPLDCDGLTIYILRRQRDEQGNRTLRTWLNGIGQHHGLVALYLGGNDIRKVDDVISPNIYIFEIKDNPNISIDMSSVCAYISAGYYLFYYDSTQDIRGCSALKLE